MKSSEGSKQLIAPV